MSGPGDDEAADRLRDEVAAAREPAELGRALVALARHERARGRALEAAELAGRAAAAHHRAEQPRATARAQRLAADCLAEADRHEDALGLLKRARRVFVTDDPSGPDVAGVEAAAARSLRALGLLEESRAALHRAERTFLAAAMPVRAAVCRLDRAVLLHDEGDPADAAELLIEARATFLAHRRPDLAAVSDFDLGVALLDDGRAEDAIERFVGARGIFASLDRRADEAACDLNMGVALHAVGRSDEARHALRRARATFRELGRDRDAEQAEHDLDVLDGLVDPDTEELSVLRDLGEIPTEVEDALMRAEVASGTPPVVDGEVAAAVADPHATAGVTDATAGVTDASDAADAPPETGGASADHQTD